MPAVTVLNGAPVRRIEVDKGKVQVNRWPYTIPAVRDLVEKGLIAATPGATLIEMGEWRMRKAKYEDLELVRSWREFLEEPERYVKYLVP
jgi:hypothetical protein